MGKTSRERYDRARSSPRRRYRSTYGRDRSPIHTRRREPYLQIRESSRTSKPIGFLVSLPRGWCQLLSEILPRWTDFTDLPRDFEGTDAQSEYSFPTHHRRSPREAIIYLFEVVEMSAKNSCSYACTAFPKAVPKESVSSFSGSLK